MLGGVFQKIPQLMKVGPLEKELLKVIGLN